MITDNQVRKLKKYLAQGKTLERFNALWPNRWRKERKAQPLLIAEPPSTWHQSRRSGRSSALPYPPGWHCQDRYIIGNLQKKNEVYKK